MELIVNLWGLDGSGGSDRLGMFLTDDVNVHFDVVADEGREGLMLPGDAVVAAVDFYRRVESKDFFFVVGFSNWLVSEMGRSISFDTPFMVTAPRATK